MAPRRWRFTTAVVVAVLAGVFAVPSAAFADRVRDAQWWLSKLRIAEAQSVSRGDGVVVGLIDSAVDDSRPELRGRVLAGKGGASGDGRGKVMDSHGTEMAGLIAGQSPSKSGYLGIAPGARILPYEQDFSEVGIADGIRWLTDHGAKVINISQGGVGKSETMSRAVQYAASHDVIVVAAAGNRNNGSTSVQTPANIPGVVAVSGVEESGNAWSGSSFGPEVVLAAPSVKIVSPAPLKAYSSGYVVADGTSPASAIVSGVVALVRSKFPGMNAANVIERLVKTSKDNGSPGRDLLFGFGTVRPYQALTDNVPEVDHSILGSPESAVPSSPSLGRGVELPPVAQESNGLPVRGLIIGGMALFAVVLVIVLAVLLARRSVKRPAPAYGPPQQYAPPYGAPQQQPQYGPPQQYGPQQQPPPQYGPPPEYPPQ